jgi:hypothetical protein
MQSPCTCVCILRWALHATTGRAPSEGITGINLYCSVPPSLCFKHESSVLPRYHHILLNPTSPLCRAGKSLGGGRGWG